MADEMLVNPNLDNGREHRVGADLYDWQYNDTYNIEGVVKDVKTFIDELYVQSSFTQSVLCDISRIYGHMSDFKRNIDANQKLGIGYYGYTVTVPLYNVPCFNTLALRRANPRIYTLDESCKINELFERRLLFFVDGKLFTGMKFYADPDRVTLIIELGNDTISLAEMNRLRDSDAEWSLLSIPPSATKRGNGVKSALFNGNKLEYKALKDITNPMSVSRNLWLVSVASNMSMKSLTTSAIGVAVPLPNGDVEFSLPENFVSSIPNGNVVVNAIALPNAKGGLVLGHARAFTIELDTNPIPPENIICWRCNEDGSIVEYIHEAETRAYFPNVYTLHGIPEEDNVYVTWFYSNADTTHFYNPLKEYMEYNPGYATDIINGLVPQAIRSYVPHMSKTWSVSLSEDDEPYEYVVESDKSHFRIQLFDIETGHLITGRDLTDADGLFVKGNEVSLPYDGSLLPGDTIKFVGKNVRFEVTQFTNTYSERHYLSYFKKATRRNHLTFKFDELLNLINDDTRRLERLYLENVERNIYKWHSNPRYFLRIANCKGIEKRARRDASREVFYKRIVDFGMECVYFVMEHEDEREYPVAVTVDGFRVLKTWQYTEGFRTFIYIPRALIHANSVLEFEIMKTRSSEPTMVEFDMPDKHNSKAIPDDFLDFSPQNILIAKREETSDFEHDGGVQYLYRVSPNYEMYWLIMGLQEYVNGIPRDFDASVGVDKNYKKTILVSDEHILTTENNEALQLSDGSFWEGGIEGYMIEFGDDNEAYFEMPNPDFPEYQDILQIRNLGYYGEARRRFYEYLPNGDDDPEIFITPITDYFANQKVWIMNTDIHKLWRFQIAEGTRRVVLKDFKLEPSYDKFRVYLDGRLLDPMKDYVMDASLTNGFFLGSDVHITIFRKFVASADIAVEYVPYRYQFLYSMNDVTNNNLQLRGANIKRPFSMVYYDIYMDGLKLLPEDVEVKSPTKIIIKKDLNGNRLSFYERGHDQEIYGNDQYVKKALIDVIADQEPTFNEYLLPELRKIPGTSDHGSADGCEGCMASCLTTCQGLCSTACDTLCVSNCSGSCQGSCESASMSAVCGGCTTGCASTCLGCTGTCSGTCKNSTSHTPDECSSCTSACSTNCTGTCIGTSTANCLGCDSTCTDGCANSCIGSVTSQYTEPTPNTPSGSLSCVSCSSSCALSCTHSCSGTATSSSCSGCSTTCMGECSSCTGSCVGTSTGLLSTGETCDGCDIACSSACGQNCTSSCLTSCVGMCSGCEGTCDNTCTTICVGNCYGDCMMECSSNCVGSAASITSTVVCSGCYASCISSATTYSTAAVCTGCDTLCTTSCSGFCTISCFSACRSGCSNGATSEAVDSETETT